MKTTPLLEKVSSCGVLSPKCLGKQCAWWNANHLTTLTDSLASENELSRLNVRPQSFKRWIALRIRYESRKLISYPLDSDSSRGWRYPPFEQLAPDVYLNLIITPVLTRIYLVHRRVLRGSCEKRRMARHKRGARRHGKGNKSVR